MKKIILSIAAVLILSAPAFSQGNIGPKVGLGISTFRHTTVPAGEKATSYQSIITPQVGIVFNAKLGDYVALRPEILYLQRGYKTEESSVTTTVRASYVEVPFNVVGCIPAGPGKVEIFAGPSVGYLVGGKYKGNNVEYKLKGADVPAEPEEDVVYANYLNVSLNAGLGYNWKGLVFQAGYNLGFSNVYPHHEDRESEAEKDRSKDVIKASSVNFAVIYLFGGKSDY